MISYLKRFIGQRGGVIGLDFGSRVLKAVQVAQGERGVEVTAAASLGVPEGARDRAGMREFFRGPVRRLLASGGFQGRRVALALPAREMHASASRRGEFGGGGGADAVSDDEAGRWLPFPSAHALLRHIEAGDVYEGGQLRREVVTLAVRRAVVDGIVDSASAANLLVQSVVAEPEALLHTLSHASSPDARAMRLIVDLGYEGTRIYAGIGRRLMFARTLPVGGRVIEQAVAAAVGVAAVESCALRARLPTLDGSNLRPQDEHLRRVDEACDEAVGRLATELTLCHHYLSTTFRDTPVHHMVFVGGGARHRRLCQRIAKRVGLPFRAGDCMSRMRPHTRVAPGHGGTASGGPDWSTALGLGIVASAAELRWPAEHHAAEDRLTALALLRPAV
jgi:Tfp pilus assembly PilM family ATPase